MKFIFCFVLIIIAIALAHNVGYRRGFSKALDICTKILDNAIKRNQSEETKEE